MTPTDRRWRIARIVTKLFGRSGLRPGQQAVIDAVLAGTHTLAIMPTGADDIAQLDLAPLHIVNTGVHRPNLTYLVRPVTSETDKQRQPVELVRGLKGAAIIHAATVKHVAQIDALLRQEGVPAVTYHGRMRASDRAAAQDALRAGIRPLRTSLALSTGCGHSAAAARSASMRSEPPRPRSPGRIRVMLTVLKQARLIRERRGPRSELTPRLFAESVDAVACAYDERRQRDQRKLEQMVVYA
jgi:hypothetical protein